MALHARPNGPTRVPRETLASHDVPLRLRLRQTSPPSRPLGAPVLAVLCRELRFEGVYPARGPMLFVWGPWEFNAAATEQVISRRTSKAQPYSQRTGKNWDRLSTPDKARAVDEQHERNGMAAGAFRPTTPATRVPPRRVRGVDRVPRRRGDRGRG